MTATIPVNGSLDVDATWATLVIHSVPGAEHLDHETRELTRLLDIDGHTLPITVGIAADHLTLTCPDGTDPMVERRIAGIVRDWFATDADLEPIRRHLSTDPLLAPLIASRPHLRVTGYPDPFEAAAVTVIGQRVSIAAARTFIARVAAAHGSPHPCGLTRFPTATVLAGVDPADLRAEVALPLARCAALVGLARAVTDGLRLEGTDAALRPQLLALRGIGPWTADHLALRVLRDPDALPASDLVLMRALGTRTAAQTRALADAWSPYRAYATVHLWAGWAAASRRIEG